MVDIRGWIRVVGLGVVWIREGVVSIIGYLKFLGIIGGVIIVNRVL